VSATDRATTARDRAVAQSRRRLLAVFTGDGDPLAPPAYRGHQWVFLIAMLVLGILAPMLFGGDDYHQGVLDNVMLYAVLALGFYWCFSLAGQFTFAVFAMYAMGAYVSTWFAQHLGGFWIGFVLAMVVTGLFGGLMRLLFIKLSPIYFAIATLATGSLLLTLFREWVAFTGGFVGISVTKVPSLFGEQLNTPTRHYYLTLGVLVVFLAATVALVRSSAMRELVFSRDNPPVAATTGLKPRHLTLMAFLVGSAMQGAAGSLYAHSSTYFSLESFSVDISLTVLLMVLLGGASSIYGPVIGAVVVVYLPELLRGARQYSDLIYAGLVLFIIVAFPTGIAGFRGIATRWVRRARGH
jgi:branched-chain amino acid transport system permease protein